MTPRERAIEATRGAGRLQWGRDDQEDIEGTVEMAIIAAVEEDRKARPHLFVGRLDRWCELCDEPDRDARHLFSRESVAASVEEKDARIKELETSLGAASHELRTALAECQRLRAALETHLGHKNK